MRFFYVIKICFIIIFISNKIIHYIYVYTEFTFTEIKKKKYITVYYYYVSRSCFMGSIKYCIHCVCIPKTLNKIILSKTDYGYRIAQCKTFGFRKIKDHNFEYKYHASQHKYFNQKQICSISA